MPALHALWMARQARCKAPPPAEDLCSQAQGAPNGRKIPKQTGTKHQAALHRTSQQRPERDERALIDDEQRRRPWAVASRRQQREHEQSAGKALRGTNSHRASMCRNITKHCCADRATSQERKAANVHGLMRTSVPPRRSTSNCGCMARFDRACPTVSPANADAAHTYKTAAMLCASKPDRQTLGAAGSQAMWPTSGWCVTCTLPG